MGWVVIATPRSLYPREGPGRRIGGWVGRRTGLDGCGKSRPHWDSIPGSSSQEGVATPTELSRSIWLLCAVMKLMSYNIFATNKFALLYSVDILYCIVLYYIILYYIILYYIILY
jgi:hypothetical protein